MAQSLMAARPGSSTPGLDSWIKPVPATQAGGIITITVGMSPEGHTLQLSGSGEGWSASGTQIVLQPTLQQALPVLYQLSFSFPDQFSVVQAGMQVSLSSATADRAVAVVNSPLLLIHNIPSGGLRQSLNLGFVVADLVQGGIIAFGDPTIVFDPPQT